MTAMEPRIIFLHIPKTAGQSVHAALVNGFGEESICTARVNDQLAGMTIRELNRFRVFSGHLDWSMLDCVDGPKYVFTILRDPLDRLLSFYFFLRKEAAMLQPHELKLPANQGKKAILELSAHEYFTGGPPHIRAFLDNHYDNFYAYFFAGRHYRARAVLQAQVRQKILTRERVLEMALDNLSRLDGVFTVDDMPAVFDAIRALAPGPIGEDQAYRTNVNADTPRADRRERLRGFGATDETFVRIEEACAMDREIWEAVSRAGRERALPAP